MMYNLSILNLPKKITMTIYFIATILLTLFLSIIWTTNGFLNTFLKIAMFIICGFGCFLLAQSQGYIVKATETKELSVEQTCHTNRMAIDQLYYDEKDNRK